MQKFRKQLSKINLYISQPVDYQVLTTNW